MVYALDYSEKAISIAKKDLAQNINFQLADATKDKKKYDVIVMSGVLEHIDKLFATKKIIKI